jgi:hypothetical protein
VRAARFASSKRWQVSVWDWGWHIGDVDLVVVEFMVAMAGLLMLVMECDDGDGGDGWC